ncbi:MAG: tetratricopeptide repeat protein [Victivallaceae bacterium]|nr:tetratricopeptide repeat protein [Victivallaceae bacterium]
MRLTLKSAIIPAAVSGILALGGCVSVKDRCLAQAEQGDAQAQGILGSMYLTGNGTIINYERAYYWLRHGAANNDSVAAYYLGVMYQYGFGKIIPDRMRADRHYKSVLKSAHDQAKQGNLRYVDILAEMYYYGRGVEPDRQRALKMFEYCVRNHWPAAIENLGVILLTGEKIQRHPDRAKSLLIEAASYNYPRAQYYLAGYYFERGKHQAAMEHLRRSVEGGFPPAMFRLAEEYSKTDSARADKLFKAAAGEGYAPAMLVIADGLSGTEEKLKWIKKAAEHSSVPAMIQYAKLLDNQINPNPPKEMILYQLALKIRPDDPRIRKLILELDNRTGLFFPVKYSWRKIYGAENILLAASEIDRILQGFKAGIISASRKLFEERLAYNPLPFFLNNDWYQIYDNGLPLLWAGLLFKAVEKQESNNPGFWIGYGISAGLAGQGTTQAFAAFKLNELLKKHEKNADYNSLKNIAVLMQANALMLLGYDAEAYSFLFGNGELLRADLPFLINFINFWCKPLLKDKCKFSIAAGIDAKKLDQFSLPQKKDFWDLEYGRMISAKDQVSEPKIDFERVTKTKR